MFLYSARGFCDGVRLALRFSSLPAFDTSYDSAPDWPSAALASKPRNPFPTHLNPISSFVGSSF